MAKIHNGKRKIAASLSIVLGISSLGAASSLHNVTSVQAASAYLQEAEARLSHLYKSLHENYLGLKNQGQWEAYIKQLRTVIRSIPSTEKASRENLTVKVDKAEKLVMALARINQVEKSMEQNSPRIGNVLQWQNYLDLGVQDLAKVDKGEFANEISELEGRKAICEDKVRVIEDDYSVKFNNVATLYENAKKTQNKDDAYSALSEAEKLGSCEATDMIKYECRILLSTIGEITLTNDEKDIYDAYKKFNNIIDTSGIDVSNTEVSNICLTIEKLLGNGIKVNATKVIENPEKGEELFNITLKKGSASLYPIGVLFK